LKWKPPELLLFPELETLLKFFAGEARRTMEPPTEATATPPARTAHFVFFNERGLRAGWRLTIFGGILYTIYFLFTAAAKQLVKYAASSGMAGAGAPKPSDLSYLFPLAVGISELFVLLVVVLITWIMSRIEHRKMREYGLPLVRSALPKFLSGCLFWGFLPLTVLLLIMRGLNVFYFGELRLHGIEILAWGLLWAFAFLMVGLLEEYLSRGYALYTLADGVGFWPAAIVMAVLFAYAHMSNGGENRVGIVGVFLYAVFASVTLRRTGNLWLAVGAHAGWDWGQSFFYGVSDSGLQTPGHLLNAQTHGPDWLSGGSVGPEGSVLALILWGLLTVGFLLWYPKRREPNLVLAATEPSREIS
jgi:membrane protease YdiL (CAAX protease family)